MKTIEQIKRLADDFTTKDNGHYHYRGKECFVKGYVDGYIQCSEDMVNRKYTEEDIREAIDMARMLSHVSCLEEGEHRLKYSNTEEDIINSLNKQD